ncbi:MAG: hypothetical protein Q9211_004759 [Gyalolechia sp. 1 TL-2023]
MSSKNRLLPRPEQYALPTNLSRPAAASPLSLPISPGHDLTAYDLARNDGSSTQGFDKLMNILAATKAGQSPSHDSQHVQDGYPSDEVSFNVGHRNLAQIYQQLDEDIAAFVEDKVRFNFTVSPGGNIFSIKMSSPVHDGVWIHCYDTFKEAQRTLVQRLRDNSDNVDSISEIQNIGAWVSRVPLENGIKSPDGGWIPDKGTFDYPTVICEVGFTQPEAELREKAKHWLERSNGRISWVLGFNIEYTEGSPAQCWFWVWQAVKQGGSYSLRAVPTFNRVV